MPEQKLILQELQFGPTYVADLVHLLGIHKHNVNKHLKDMHERGLIRIVGYDRNPDGHPWKLWGLGPGKDAIWKPFTAAERAKRVRVKRKLEEQRNG
jgi:predicted ArsR family transcriptional regulator